MFIDRRFARYKVFHASGEDEESEEIAQYQGDIKDETITREIQEIGDFAFYDQIADAERDRQEESENSVIGNHAAPID